MAGDMTEFGDRENVVVIRETDGVREIGRLNIKSKKIFESPYYYLQQNDVVYVDPINARARETSAFQDELPDHRIGARFPRKLHRDAHLLHNQRKRQITDPQS